MIPFRVSVVAAIAAIIFLLVIFELIRSRRLQERYALLWLITGGVILLLSVWRDALRLVAEQIGIAYPPSALFVVGFLFILAVLLHYSTVISELAERNVMLAQDIALLEERLRIQERATEQRCARSAPRLAGWLTKPKRRNRGDLRAPERRGPRAGRSGRATTERNRAEPLLARARGRARLGGDRRAAVRASARAAGAGPRRASSLPSSALSAS